MKSKKILYILLLLSLGAGILFASGASDYFATVEKYSGTTQMIPLSEIPLAITISGWLTLAVVVLGVIRTVMLKQWKSLVLMVILSYIGVAIYSFLDLKRLQKA